MDANSLQSITAWHLETTAFTKWWVPSLDMLWQVLNIASVSCCLFVHHPISFVELEQKVYLYFYQQSPPHAQFGAPWSHTCRCLPCLADDVVLFVLLCISSIFFLHTFLLVSLGFICPKNLVPDLCSLSLFIWSFSSLVLLRFASRC